jgi:hypothetical protein
MNKSFLFLAVFSLAIFSACSDDKGPCDDGPSKDCLAGRWKLTEVIDGNTSLSTRTGNLIVTGGFYDFNGGELDYTLEGDILSIEGNTITIRNYDSGETLSGTITLSGENAFTIKSATSKALFSFFSTPRVANPTEKFIRN